MDGAYHTRILRDCTEVRFRTDTAYGRLAIEAEKDVPDGTWAGSDLNEKADEAALAAFEYDVEQEKKEFPSLTCTEDPQEIFACLMMHPFVSRAATGVAVEYERPLVVEFEPPPAIPSADCTPDVPDRNPPSPRGDGCHPVGQ